MVPPMPTILAFIVIPAKAGIQARPTRLHNKMMKIVGFG
jgi:hypothetical protein